MIRKIALMAPLVLACVHANRGPALGVTGFPVTGGNEIAREHFNRGLLALHSFWYEEAVPEMEAAVKADPTFAMGWWGVAMSHCQLLWYQDDLAAGREALAKIGPTDRLTPLERDWIGAARALFGEGNALARRQAFTAALEVMEREHPQDDDVVTYLSAALIASSPPDDPRELAVRARSAALADEVFRRNPQHPGAAHYLIHALDTADLAPLALPAARAYAAIAPDAFHARHMPAHIFSRLGMWTEALASCQSAWDSSVASAARTQIGPNGHDFHSMNWIFELDFQLGRRQQAEASVAGFAAAVKGGLNYRWRRVYLFEVASFLDRTGDWDRLEEFLAPLSAPPVDPRAGAAHSHDGGAQPSDLETPPREALERRYLAEVRLQAAAHRRDTAAVERLLAEVEKSAAEVRPWMEHQLGAEEYAKRQSEAALDHQAAAARARADDAALLEQQRKLAEIADKQPLGEWDLFDGGIHQDIAETLLRLKRPQESLAEYRRVLQRHPRDGRVLLGASRAAAQAGDASAAQSYARQALAMWAGGDADFVPAAEARRLAGDGRTPPAGP